MNEYTHFGERLRNSIKMNSKTQKELCAIWQINETTLVRYLSGDRLPKIDLLEAISETLNVSVDWLITGKEFASELTEDEIEMLESYRRCTQPNKEILKSTAAALSGGSQEQAASSSTLKIG